jgi:tetratricopeptide (TPR) repeat protein
MSEELIALTEKAKSDFQKKQFHDAAEGFKTCLGLLQNSGSSLEIAEMRNNLSVALLRSSEPQAALDAVLGTEASFAEAGDIQKKGMALANTASAYEALKEYELAASAYQQAIDCFKESGDKKLRSITLRSLSDLQLKTGNQYVALATLQASYNEKPQANFKDKFFASALGRVIQKLLGH